MIHLNISYKLSVAQQINDTLTKYITGKVASHSDSLSHILSEIQLLEKVHNAFSTPKAIEESISTKEKHIQFIQDVLRSISISFKLQYIICPCVKHANMEYKWYSGTNIVASRNNYFERANLLTNYCYLRVEYVKKYPQMVKDDIPKLLLAASACQLLRDECKEYLVPMEKQKEFSDNYLNLRFLTIECQMYGNWLANAPESSIQIAQLCAYASYIYKNAYLQCYAMKDLNENIISIYDYNHFYFKSLAHKHLSKNYIDALKINEAYLNLSERVQNLRKCLETRKENESSIQSELNEAYHNLEQFEKAYNKQICDDPLSYSRDILKQSVSSIPIWSDADAMTLDPSIMNIAQQFYREKKKIIQQINETTHVFSTEESKFIAKYNLNLRQDSDVDPYSYIQIDEISQKIQNDIEKYINYFNNSYFEEEIAILEKSLKNLNELSQKNISKIPLQRKLFLTNLHDAGISLITDIKFKLETNYFVRAKQRLEHHANAFCAPSMIGALSEECDLFNNTFKQFKKILQSRAVIMEFLRVLGPVHNFKCTIEQVVADNIKELSEYKKIALATNTTSIRNKLEAQIVKIQSAKEKTVTTVDDRKFQLSCYLSSLQFFMKRIDCLKIEVVKISQEINV